MVRGKARVAKDVAIFAERSGGPVIARFSGGEIPLTVSDFPGAPGGRAVVETGTGAGSFKFRGFLVAEQLPLFTAREVPVVAGHVAIGQGREVTLVSAAPDRLTVKKRLVSPIRQTFTGSAPCSAFTLEPRTAPGWNVPGGARGYVVKSDSVDLYDTWTETRQRVLTLHRAAESTGILLFSTEKRQGWVHLYLHSDIVIDAWARARDLAALPPGETMDQLRGPVIQRGSPRLALAGNPKLVRTNQSIPIRLSAKESAPVVGQIEPDTEAYVLDVIAGWASVLPKALNVVPDGEQHFWVKATELGI
jgi:hypothetical protein